MKIVNILIIAIIVLLSIAAGLAKVMQAPQEMEFLQGVGLSNAMIIAFGLVQILAGVLLVPQKTRIPGAVLAALALLVSTVLIFVSGNLVFALVSIIPIALVGIIIYQTSRKTQNNSLIADKNES